MVKTSKICCIFPNPAHSASKTTRQGDRMSSIFLRRECSYFYTCLVSGDNSEDDDDVVVQKKSKKTVFLNFILYFSKFCGGFDLMLK